MHVPQPAAQRQVHIYHIILNRTIQGSNPCLLLLINPNGGNNTNKVGLYQELELFCTGEAH